MIFMSNKYLYKEKCVAFRLYSEVSTHISNLDYLTEIISILNQYHNLLIAAHFRLLQITVVGL